MIGTALSYVALRLLGEGPYDGSGAVERARKWILDQGGASSIPSWGKTYLSVIVLLKVGTEDYFYNNIIIMFLCLTISEDQSKFLYI